MTVYADILLLVNVSMDILSLYIVGRAVHKKMTPLRLLLAALVGGIFATAATLFYRIDGIGEGTINIIGGIFLSLIMTLISFGKPCSALQLIRDSVMLWGSGALIGGLMSIVLSMGEPISPNGENSFLSAVAIVAVAAIGIERLISSRGAKGSAIVTVAVGDKLYKFSGLCDSGSFATEPISGLPVIIVKADAMGNVYSMLRGENSGLRIRLVPIGGVGGDRLLYGFVPDLISVNGKEVAAVIAFDDSGGTFAEHMAIIPAVLCRKA